MINPGDKRVSAFTAAPQPIGAAKMDRWPHLIERIGHGAW